MVANLFAGGEDIMIRAYRYTEKGVDAARNKPRLVEAAKRAFAVKGAAASGGSWPRRDQASRSRRRLMSARRDDNSPDLNRHMAKNTLYADWYAKLARSDHGDSKLPKAAIFDLDGTPLDSVDLHALAWRESVREEFVEKCRAWTAAGSSSVSSRSLKW
jgi:hypothetical protein